MNTQRVDAAYTTTKKLGNWTDSRDFEVRARRGYVVLDLRSPRIPDGDITVRIGADRSAVKLLLPDDAVVDQWDLRIVGRGKVKDWTRPQDGEAGAGGRRIRLTGEIRRGEVRIARGGVAVLTAMFSKDFVQDCRRARREGGEPTVHDPAHSPA